jgi:hypothetical protein
MELRLLDAGVHRVAISEARGFPHDGERIIDVAEEYVRGVKGTVVAMGPIVGRQEL